MREAVIVSGSRTPVGKAKKGSFASVRPDDLAAITVKETLKRANNYDGPIDDVIIGCAMPEAEQGMNMARNIVALSGLPYTTPAITINRYCSSGLQSIVDATYRIQSGAAKTIIAGGAESMTMVPMGGHVIRPNVRIMEEMPEYYMTMGNTAEQVAREFQVSRQAQDEFAVWSHQKAAKALAEGKFKEEIVPVPVTLYTPNGEKNIEVTTDEGVRPDTTVEGLQKLRPAFHIQGSVTAGNASQMSDGAASVLVMDREVAEAEGLKPLAKLRSFAVAGVRPEIMGIGPVEAIPKALQLASLQLEDIDLIELNEAFASQSVQIMRALQLEEEKLNVNGGAIALGHPLGCTGTKLTVSLIHEMKRRQSQFGIVTMCIGGGMGACGVFELLL
ncbi:acetyl-CoA C-acetyltransferase [Massilibacterium senegalense]|uniref:acetyl-CoA C-acetyltransferase n=1 Tax=Massilibacterium senegalense TaxID=1632858 RepID=UPI0007850798|nr:acetyl-CoA C-acetyltransferase [Massilibacterium senegalense]